MNIAEIRAKFPQYNDLSDVELAQSLHAKYYADIPVDQFASMVGLQPVEKPQRQEPSTIDQLKRQAGLTLRHGVEGLVGGTAGIFIDPFQRLAGAKTTTQATSDLLDRMGVPKPDGATEEAVGAISRGIAGAGGFTGLARGLPAAMKAAPEVVNNVFAQAPGVQIAQAATGAGASELAKQGGAEPWQQMVVGAVAPLGVGAGMSAVGAVKRGARELVRPLTTAGSEQIAADVLGGVTADKTTALANLAKYNAEKAAEAAGGPVVGVPGSRPMAADVAGDYGLAGASQLAERGAQEPLFKAQRAANNTARLEDLAKLRATESQIQAYTAHRDAVTDALREQVFNNAQQMVDYQPVVDKILKVMATPAGGAAESRKALQELTGWVGRYLEEGRLDPRNAYELHKDIGKLVGGKLDSGSGRINLAGGLANEIKKTLADQIEAAAPGFQKYLETYTRLTKPIDRLQVISDRLGGENLSRVTNAAVMTDKGEARFALSQAKMKNAVNDLDTGEPLVRNGRPLAPYQSDILRRVQGDLNAEQAGMAGRKLPGSDTYQNMATANFLRGVVGESLANSSVAGAVAKPVSVLLRPLESRINEIIGEALRDPALAERLLRQARMARQSPSLFGAAQDAGTGVSLGALGAALAQQ